MPYDLHVSATESTGRPVTYGISLRAIVEHWIASAINLVSAVGTSGNRFNHRVRTASGGGHSRESSFSYESFTCPMQNVSSPISASIRPSSAL